MTIEDKNEMATIVVTAMKKEYGFAPQKKQLVFLEFCGNSKVGFDYIMFAVSGGHYAWQISKRHGVWVVDNVDCDKEYRY